MEVGKDRENTFEFKAFASEPHTAPAEYLERAQFLVWHLRFPHLSLQQPTGFNQGYWFTISAIKVLLEKQTDRDDPSQAPQKLCQSCSHRDVAF